MASTQVLIAEVRATGKLSKASWLELLAAITYKTDSTLRASYFVGQVSALGYMACTVWKQLVNAVEVSVPASYLSACSPRCGIDSTRLIEFIAEVGPANPNPTPTLNCCEDFALDLALALEIALL